MKPIYRQISVSEIRTFAHANEHHIIEIATPPAGRTFVVTRVTVLGNDDVSANNLIAAVYIGDNIKANPIQAVISAQPIPFTTTVNSKALIVQSTETLFLYVHDTVGNIGPEQVVANIQVLDYPDTFIAAQVI